MHTHTHPLSVAAVAATVTYPYVVTCDSGASYVTNEPVTTGTLAASVTPVWGESVYASPASATAVMGSGYTVSATN